jgi:diguanylate cyclase
MSNPHSPPPPEIRRAPWLVRNNYRIRGISFFLVFFGLGMELWKAPIGPLPWILLALQFLVYPHALFWWTRRRPEPNKTELNNLILDSFLIGIWIAALSFPVWPSFTLALACFLNVTLTRGFRPLLAAILALVIGVLLWGAVYGFRFAPETEWPTTTVMLVGIAGYVLAIGRVAHLRNAQLRAAREKLRWGEQTLHASNKALEDKLSEIEVLQTQLKDQALKDPLTGLFNRRYLDTIVPHELARCGRESSQLCLMMMDIDHFKRVNDTYGHQGGDAVLKSLANLLIDSVRASDVACRFGGEEFLLLLPNMTPEIALQRAEQWRASFAASSTESANGVIKATLSIGIACFPDDGASLAELTRCADVALYRAKAEGRDRVVLCRANFGGEPVPVNGEPIQKPTPGSYSFHD